uniref:Uncharacterized protein n=1 Tax=Onchocerca volvulus TaxID=6282 RepID=A0A2K6W568_ONCVO
MIMKISIEKTRTMKINEIIRWEKRKIKAVVAVRKIIKIKMKEMGQQLMWLMNCNEQKDQNLTNKFNSHLCGTNMLSALNVLRSNRQIREPNGIKMEFPENDCLGNSIQYP